MFLVIGSGCEGAETAPVEPCKAAGTVICQLTSRSLDAAATLTRSSVERHRTFFRQRGLAPHVMFQGILGSGFFFHHVLEICAHNNATLA